MASYASLADARNEGVPVSISDGDVQEQLDRWTDFIDAATKQWFEPRTLTLLLDGNNSRTLFLPVPIITLDELYMNNDFTNKVDSKLYAVYNRRDAARDDRRNPMIKLAGGGLGVFDVPDFRMGMCFQVGEQNQKLVGTFGFTESDGSTPKLIKRAVLKLAIRELQRGSGSLWEEVANGGIKAGGGVVTSETTDGHTISYSAFSMGSSKPGLNGITNDPEVDRIIDLYRGPIKVTSTMGHGGPDRRW